MKKVIPILLLLFFLSAISYQDDQEVVIPKEAIRFRVIPNSNLAQDQQLKLEVKEQVQGELHHLLGEVNSVEDARKKLSSNLIKIENKVEETLKEQEVEEDFSVRYGLNYFPEKTYRGITYKEGYYESLVVTLGEGKGDNWWCVLFPPLCLLEGEETGKEEVEYKSFVKELIDRFF